jgi:HPt (histidine-containing phosphotransfer) domain-containing protein
MKPVLHTWRPASFHRTNRRLPLTSPKTSRHSADKPDVEPDDACAPALDREQLRDVAMDDEELMREVLNALWDDTTANVPKLREAVHNRDSDQCVRLAHYSKGACANVGASAAAALFRDIECGAREREFERCAQSLAALGAALEELRGEIAAF